MAKILIIDDDQIIQKLFKSFLAREGYEVLQAENGKKGIALINEEQPDLVITDILMPEMDGLEILLSIRGSKNNVPVIAISGGSRNLPINFLRQAKMFGARHVFHKPVPLDVLHKAVKELLEENNEA